MRPVDFPSLPSDPPHRVDPKGVRERAIAVTLVR
jgi:hypothetical protein